MKTKILSLLAIAGLVFFTGCASEDTANKQTEHEPSTEGLTGFVEEVPETRTTADYDGTGLNFYWTAGDRIWVNNGGTLTQDAYNNISSKLENNPANPTAVQRAAKAKFWFNGTFTASSYPVRYTGKNGVADKVTIKASQTQTIPNDASHIGEDGDCGIATAQKQSDGKYHFTLDHKAAYATFVPYSTQTVVQEGVIQKIKVTAEKAICGQFDFTDNGIDEASRPAATDDNKSITLTCKTSGHTSGLAIPAVAQPGINAITMVIAPGTYSTLTVEYTIASPITWAIGTITKKYTNVTFTAGKNKKISQDLQATVYPFNGHYMWDALQGFWAGHLNANGEPDGNFPMSNADPRWHNEVPAYSDPTGNAPAVTATNSCANCPNVNELLWYAFHGDPHYDNILWTTTTMKHLYAGGIWLKKKDNITGYNPSAAPDGTNYTRSTITFTQKQNSNIPSGRPANLNNYFFLPHLGYYYTGGIMYGLGDEGAYWSSTPCADTGNNIHFVYVLSLYTTDVFVSKYTRDVGFWPWDSSNENQYRPIKSLTEQ